MPYPKQKKIKFKPRIKLNHNSNLWELNIRGSLLRRGPDLNHYFLEANLLYIICSFLGHFPFVRTEWPDHSRHIENGWFQKISIPYHGWHEYFNPPLPSEIPKCLSPPCPPNSKIANPPSPPEFSTIVSDPLEFLFVCLNLQTNEKLALFPSAKEFCSQF